MEQEFFSASRNRIRKEGAYLREFVLGEPPDERRLADLGVADDDDGALHPGHGRRHRVGKLDRRRNWRGGYFCCCCNAEIPI